jgi:hypothetical protein
MNELFFPINIAFQSLFFGLYGFVGNHFKESGAHEDKDCDDFMDVDIDEPPLPSEWTSTDKVLKSWAVWWSMYSTKGGIYHAHVDKWPCAIPEELPPRLLAAIRSDSSAPVAIDYRRFIVHEWLPGVKRIHDIIAENGHLLEAIPTDKLEKVFNEPPVGNRNWNSTTRGMFFSMWIAYTRSWENVVDRWESGCFQEIRPSVAFPTGVYCFVILGQTTVGDIQKQLTGQSSMHGIRGVERNSIWK